MNTTPELMTPSQDRAEPMVDARQACVALRLPHYWFADPLMRKRFLIPHYVIGGLVRYRMSELQRWASQVTQTPRGHQSAPSSHAPEANGSHESTGGAT